ncbi:MAG: hypothetical protein ACRDON_05340 [Gaiellaceae bacterium]
MSSVVDVLRFFLELVIGAGLSVAFFVGVILLVRLVFFVGRLRATRRPAATPFWSPPPPSWSLTLLVDVDHEARLFRPSVQLRGSTLQFPPTLRLELVDDSGQIRSSCERSLPPWTIGGEVALPAFTAPHGATTEDVLGWHWDVVMEDQRGELARWREHPGPAGSLNAEAEIQLPGVAEV